MYIFDVFTLPTSVWAEAAAEEDDDDEAAEAAPSAAPPTDFRFLPALGTAVN